MFAERSNVNPVDQVAGLADGVGNGKTFSTFVNFNRSFDILRDESMMENYGVEI
jgi:hypothetical protein